MSRYQKGYRHEKEVRRHYESLGYYVIESRGSHGIADLIAGNGEETLVIQVKDWKMLGTIDKDKLLQVAKLFNGTAVIAYKKDYHDWNFVKGDFYSKVKE